MKFPFKVKILNYFNKQDKHIKIRNAKNIATQIIKMYLYEINVHF